MLRIFLVAAVVFGCSNSTPPNAKGKSGQLHTSQNNEAIVTVEYRFRDSSTAPQYHRSHTIVANKSGVTTTVDVYGEVIAQDKQPMTQDQWTELTKAVGEMSSPFSMVEVNATGTKEWSIKGVYENGSSRVWRWDSYRPNKMDQGNLTRGRDLVSKLERLSPRLSELRKTSYSN